MQKAMKFTVYPVHTLLRADQPPKGAAVVIDTLRMTTVAATAMENGCKALWAVSTVEEANELAQSAGALRGGERGAVRIDGFELSNSPLEYTREAVGGRSLVLTTTNGTQAIASASGAPRLYLGCLRNAGAVARLLRGEEDVTIVLAGTGGRFSLEDALTAGAILDRLGPGEDDDMALAARTLYRQNRAAIHELLSPCAHYRHLQAIGYGADLSFCLKEDCADAVPFRLAGEGAFCARTTHETEEMK